LNIASRLKYKNLIVRHFCKKGTTGGQEKEVAEKKVKEARKRKKLKGATSSSAIWETF